MDSFLHNQGGDKPTATGHHHNHPKPTTSDLMSSAKVMAEAAQHTFRHEADMVDKSRVAGAAENLLYGASTYGHLEEKGFGQYIDKAGDYLHKYSSHTTTTTTGGGHHTTTTTTSTTTGGGGKHSGDQSGGAGGFGGGDYMKMAQGFLGGGHNSSGQSGGGGGDYMKMAEGFLGGGHHHSSGQSGGGGDYGDYLKMAEGFLKKH